MGWGSSSRRGGGQKLRALPRKFVFLGFEERNLGCPGNFAGMSRTPWGVQKFVLKKFVRIFCSLFLLLPNTRLLNPVTAQNRTLCRGSHCRVNFWNTYTPTRNAYILVAQCSTTRDIVAAIPLYRDTIL